MRYRLRPDLAVRTGVYQVDAQLGDQRNAFNPFGGDTTGVLLPLEVEYDPGVAADPRFLPGHYRLGVYYDTSRAARRAGEGSVLGRYGMYLLADQTVLRGTRPGTGLAVFGQFTANPRASAQIDRWYAAGLVRTGTFGGRDRDTVALGLVHAQLNPRLRRSYLEAAADGYVALPAGETAIELSYGIQLRRWLIVKPDVQYIVDPGAFGYRTTGNALALGSQMRVQF